MSKKDKVVNCKGCGAELRSKDLPIMRQEGENSIL